MTEGIDRKEERKRKDGGEETEGKRQRGREGGEETKRRDIGVEA